MMHPLLTVHFFIFSKALINIYNLFRITWYTQGSIQAKYFYDRVEIQEEFTKEWINNWCYQIAVLIKRNNDYSGKFDTIMFWES